MVRRNALARAAKRWAHEAQEPVDAKTAPASPAHAHHAAHRPHRTDAQTRTGPVVTTAHGCRNSPTPAAPSMTVNAATAPATTKKRYKQPRLTVRSRKLKTRLSSPTGPPGNHSTTRGAPFSHRNNPTWRQRRHPHPCASPRSEEHTSE